MIELEKLNRREAIRYLGGGKAEMNDTMRTLLDECEKELLNAAEPKFLYRETALPDEEILLGNDIREHLLGCQSAVIMCATLGAGADRLIRVAQIRDMSKAVVLDALASVAIEQVCSRLDEMIAQSHPEKYLTFRFSPGYGDYPVSLQKTFLQRLDAPRKIGLSATESCMLIPSKSVTAVLGISNEPVPRKKRGCAACNLRQTCMYRKNGDHCGFSNPD